MVQIYEQPVLPKLARILFQLMWILLGAMLLVEINAFARYDFRLGIGHLIYNIAVTGMGEWLVFTVLELMVGVSGMYANQKRFYQQKKKSGILSITEEDIDRDHRAIKKLNASYLFYEKTCGIGLICWTVFYLIVRTVD